MPRHHPAPSETWLVPQPPLQGRVRGVLLFPSSYAVGMSSLATHTLFELLNAEGIVCERAFADPDKRRPVTSVETGTRLDDFDFVAVTTSYEIDWLAIVHGLLDTGIPLRREERTRGPLVLMGGPSLTCAPLPLAQVYDAAFIGEIEPAIGVLRKALTADSPEEALELLASEPGFYVPDLHGTPAPASLRRRCLRDLDSFPTASVALSAQTLFANRHLVEIGRGCGRGCKFCLARQAYAPLRWRSLDAILDAVRRGLQHTRDLGLIAAAVSDYPDLSGLCQGLRSLAPDLRVSTSSIRLESATSEFLELLAQGGQQTVTFAPEAASEALRTRIGKTMPDAALYAAVERAVAAGLTRIRLYFMVGLPTETAEDREALYPLAADLAQTFKQAQFQLSVGAFSPRPHTPFAAAPLAPLGELQQWLGEPVRRLRQVKRVSVSTDSAQASALQCLFSRADDRLAPALAQVPDMGYAGLLRALRAAGLDVDALLGPQPDTPDEPWKVVDYRCAD